MKHNYCTPIVEIVIAEILDDVFLQSTSAGNEALITEGDTNWW